ncbi:hypothetical protein GpartN1_g2386.t1 [Galdieria partita]|uniref:Uncharacterized protein n=1 Tax=Galdieria partita TaxID=83374 RepID=A0A9C7PU92_9RHOD|nr:hypothetical protein GpartN1_g2386.t1 [Galdieria partita]
MSSSCLLFCSVSSSPQKLCRLVYQPFMIDHYKLGFVSRTVVCWLKNLKGLKHNLYPFQRNFSVYANIQLEADKRVPVVLLASTALCSRPILNWEWLEVFLGILTVVAFFQVFTYKIEFTENAFRIIRSGKLIRSYPYTEWLGWRFIPSSQFPILLYFKEYNERRESEGGPMTRWHLLPVLYNPLGFVKMIESNLPGNSK